LDEVDERIVKKIEEKFRAEERKLSRRTFTDFVKRFWLTHRAGFGSEFSTNRRARLSMRRRSWRRRRLGSPPPGWGEVEDKELAEENRPEQDNGCSYASRWRTFSRWIKPACQTF
jgi:hypothetical protein